MASNLTLSGATFNASGKFGQSLNGGSGQAANPLPSSGPVTIEAWGKTIATGVQVLCGSSHSAWIGTTSDGKAQANFGGTAGGAPDFFVISTVTVNDGAWHHFSFNIDPQGTGAKLYVDGVLAASTASKGTITPDSLFGVRIFGGVPSFGWNGEVDEVAIYSGLKRTANFTPPTAATLNNDANLLALWHLEGSGVDSANAAVPGVDIAYNDAKVIYSPYNWDDQSTYKVSGTPGAYAKLAFSGTSVAVKVDVSALVAASVSAGSYPIVRTVVDGVSFVDTQLTSGTTDVARTGLSNGAHTLEFYFLAADINVSDRWNTPVNAVRISGFTLDAGAALSTYSTRSKSMLYFGDSLTEGMLSLGTTTSMPVGNSALHAIPPVVAQEMDCEYGVVGLAGQGYQSSGNGNVPAWPSAYGLYSAGRSRLVSGKFSPAPDYIVVEHGTNGTTTAANVQAMIANLRAAAPLAKIFMLVSSNGFARSAITGGVAAAADANAYLIDPGVGFANGVSSYGAGPNMWSQDGLHRNILANARLGAAYMDKMRFALDGVAQPSLTARTVTLALGDTLGALANLVGIKVAAFDEATPDLRAAPRYKSSTQVTNASGVLSFVMQSTLAAGGLCGVSVQLADGRNFDVTAAVA